MSEQTIRASEIGEYVYCHRAWWLKRFGGYRSSYVRELAAGRQYHEAHGALVYRSQLAKQVALLLIFLGTALLVFMLVALA